MNFGLSIYVLVYVVGGCDLTYGTGYHTPDDTYEFRMWETSNLTYLQHQYNEKFYLTEPKTSVEARVIRRLQSVRVPLLSPRGVKNVLLMVQDPIRI